MNTNKELTLEELKTKGYQIKEQDTFMIVNGKLDIKLLEEKGTPVGATDGYQSYTTHYYETTLDDGTYIDISGNEINGYTKKITKKNNLIVTNYDYHSSGNIKTISYRYPNGFNKGTFYWYNKQGIINRIEDYDKPYQFTWEDVLVFIQKKEIKKEEIYRIFRDVQEEKGTQKPYWYISKITAVDGLDSPTSIIKYTLDGNTGKIIKEEIVDVTRHLE